MKKLLFFLVIVLTLPVATALGQADRVIIQREGRGFFVHKVEQGHTLYSLSKLYQTTIEEIEASNPGISQNLALGQTIYIPVPEDHNPKEWTNPIRLENGDMIHKVQKKETLYGICREYTIDINRLLEANPEAEKGIQPGMELRIPPNDLHEPDTVIPVGTVEKPTTTIIVEAPGTFETNPPQTQWKRHTVAQGETLYGICRNYQVDQQELLDLNDGLPAGLRTGDEILIPIKNNTAQTPSEKLDDIAENKSKYRRPADTSYVRDEYNIVLMLPLALDFEISDDRPMPSSVERLREIAMSFYHGSLAAFDSLEAKGARLNVTVLDVHQNSDLNKMLDHPAVRQSDLIIGPFQRKALEKVAAFASRNNIHIVCPVPQSNSVLLNHATLSKVQPSPESQVRALANHVFDTYRGENILLINSKDLADLKAVNTFKQTYLSRLRTVGDTALTGIAEIEGSSKFVGDLQSRLSKGRRNIIVVPAGSHSRSMIANLQSKIQLLGKDHDIIVCGLNEWTEFDFIDVSFKERTQMILPAPVYTDYQSDLTENFIANYRNEFNADPSGYALLGHDIALYYGRALMLYGTAFPLVFEQLPNEDLLHLKFRYRKTGLDSGFENEHVFILHHHDFYLDPIGHVRN